MTFRIEKVVAALPNPLEPDTLYAVRAGAGFDLYMSDALGQTAHPINPPAAGGALGPHAMEAGLASLDYVTAAINALALATAATAAGRLDLMPFRPGKTITIDRLVAEVTTAVAASQARIGIYGSAATGLPGALLTGQGSLLDCATTGFKNSPITGGLTLNAGSLYWLAVHGSSTQTFRALAVGALLPLPMSETATAHNTLRRATATFANGLPANAPATALTSASAPLLKMRIQ